MSMSGDAARYAYSWGLANIEYMCRPMDGDIERILDRIGAGMATEAALKEVLHSDYDDLMQSTVDYLRRPTDVDALSERFFTTALLAVRGFALLERG